MLIHALELNPDGRYRFRTVVLLVGRQNGKSTLLQVWALWRMYMDRAPLVIGTAQNLDVAEEQWAAAVDMAETNDELAEEIKDVKRTNGKYALELTGGERYKVAAASRKGGRGLSGDLIIMDELREHTNWESWSAVTKTTMARFSPQVVCASNAGDASSVVLSTLRNGCLESLKEGTTDDSPVGLFEWSAMKWNPTGGKDRSGDWENLKTSDREGWGMANPSMGWGNLTMEALEAAWKTDPDPVFRTECLCQWVTTARGGAFEDGLWESLKDVNSGIIGAYYYGLDVSWDRSFATITVAGYREDGKIHGEVVEAMTIDRALKWFTRPSDDGRWERRIDDPDCMGVALQQNGAPVSALIGDLVKEGVPLVEWGGGELGRGTGQFYDVVRQKALHHTGQPILDIAVAMALTRPIADYWVWDRKRSLVDIAPLIALTAAVWALKRPEEQGTESSYSDPDMMFV